MLLVSPDFRDTGSTGRGGARGSKASAEAAGQGQVAGRFSSGGPPPCGRRQLPLSAEGRGPGASEACTGQGSPLADSRCPGCKPVTRPSSLQGPRRVRGPRCCGRCSSPRRQSSRPCSLFPFQLSANLPVKSGNYDDCPSAKSRENYKLLQNPPC